ncbi:MAG: patatin-like phospholipase family protein [Burkholderiaceae bacterium]|nr:MAG: patatin-like phospholipase family protein [Burkholderiaceae bacterium]TAM04338.1 MAG: patatin-like phospholipase family protein [Pusillimonas sp.]
MNGKLTLPPYQTVALVLQGGGALGAYQAGVFQGLNEAGISPNWFTGISIGALNTAIIAGNPIEKRVERLHEFWDTICQPNVGVGISPFFESHDFGVADFVRNAMNAMSAGNTVLGGQMGFFCPRFPPPLWNRSGAPGTASYYSTHPLKETLERLCDFDRINSRELHVSVGAVNVRTGNFTYFDNSKTTLRAEHFMASGALPPAFPAIEIDGERYWDGGLVSNTPLSQVLESKPLKDTLAFQVDLWSARGTAPTNLEEVADREKDIRYSSRTRLVTEQLRHSQSLRRLVQNMLNDIPEKIRAKAPYYKTAQALACNKRYNVIHLIYQNKSYERHYKDFEFSPASMQEHWSSGLEDIRQTLAAPHYLNMPTNESGFVTHDVHNQSNDPT